MFGGAAMALAYDARRSTRDIGAVFKPHGIVLEAARLVANELGLPPWWLNEQASVYVAPGGDSAAPRVFDHPGLRVSAASPEHLLAMKLLAARRRDNDDIRFLVKHLGLCALVIAAIVHGGATIGLLTFALIRYRRGDPVEANGLVRGWIYGVTANVLLFVACVLVLRLFAYS